MHRSVIHLVAGISIAAIAIGAALLFALYVREPKVENILALYQQDAGYGSLSIRYPLDETLFPLSKAGAVYDMIYRPAETPLLKAARAAGCRVSNGLGMLLYQGAKALEIWSGRPAPIATMREALEKNVYGL